MPLRLRRIPGLPLLACLLIGLASADDFCLPRLAFLGTVPDAPLLPLDDPNTDFVEAGDSCLVRRSTDATGDWPRGNACRARVGCATIPRSPFSDHFVPPGNRLSPPLRC
jgi:hypothetical protein